MPRKVTIGALLGTAIVFLAIGYLVLPAPSLDRSERLSALVLARDGSILRGFLSADGKWRLPTVAGEIDPLYRDMLIATEDRRFASHFGIDPLAIGRALVQFAQHGHAVSGASTLTMQAVRLLERRKRTLAAKLAESGEALALERRLDKNAMPDRPAHRGAARPGDAAQHHLLRLLQFAGAEIDAVNKAHLGPGGSQPPGNAARQPQQRRAAIANQTHRH
jgi:hypothetical protein